MKTLIISEKDLPLMIILDNGVRDSYQKFTDILADIFLETGITPSEIAGKDYRKNVREARERFIKDSLKNNFSIPEIAAFLKCEISTIHNYMHKRKS